LLQFFQFYKEGAQNLKEIRWQPRNIDLVGGDESVVVRVKPSENLSE
jgi:hypothetical protein